MICPKGKKESVTLRCGLPVPVNPKLLLISNIKLKNKQKKTYKTKIFLKGRRYINVLAFSSHVSELRSKIIYRFIHNLSCVNESTIDEYY